MDDNTPKPVAKFKKRKPVQAKRTRLEFEDDPADGNAAAPEDDGTSLKLKEALRSIKRPRDRQREAVARAEATKAQALALRQQQQKEQDAPKLGYAGRFVPQTGQVVDGDEKQITEYVEARLAEQNHRLYGWPIPPHLAAVAATFAPKPVYTAPAPAVSPFSVAKPAEPDHGKNHRLAAGMGKLQEVDLGPASTSRAEAALKKLEGGQPDDQPASKARLGRDGKPRRQQKRRNSADLRRDEMVEAVLRESKLDYFDEEVQTGPAGNDEALVEQFRQEYLESLESRQQHKPVAPAHGAKEAPKGPKLGGSRSARAAMQAQKEQAAKGNKR